MTATDELRRLLDERGVEWRAYTDLTRGAMELFHSTYFDMPNGCKARAASIIDSDLVLLTFRTTPEQAIAATVGPKVCHMSYNELSNTSICLACGWRMDGKPNFCPNCGGKVVDE